MQYSNSLKSSIIGNADTPKLATFHPSNVKSRCNNNPPKVNKKKVTKLGAGHFTTRIFGDAGNDFSSGRLEIWSTKFADAKENLEFGIGFDSSQRLDGLMAHNQFLTVTEEVGIVGLVLFIGFLIAVLNYLSPGLSRNPYLPALICSATLLMGDSFLFGWRNPNSMLTWMVLLLALGYSVSITKSRQQARHDTTSREGQALIDEEEVLPC